VFGFHSLLQQKGLPYDSFETYRLNNQIFKLIESESKIATQQLAEEYGEPEWCKGYGVRNTHTIALAPTVTNAIISGNVSPSIEPWTANAFARKTAKGTFIHRNSILEALLESKNKNDEQVWNSIVSNEGSVQHLDFLSSDEKATFLTAREINQFVIVKLAAQRQKYIDQAQSINLFFPSNADPTYIHKVHMMAYHEGLKTLYYCRAGSVLKGDSGSRAYKREENECVACEG
jgi:ribonucleoside-diphosphate reductase alpha chain